MGNANNFKRKNNQLTAFRVRRILQYIIYCYLRMLEDEKKYTYSEKGKIKKEEFLRNGLVFDYLQKKHNKDYYKHHISDNPSVKITFHPEESMPFQDFDNNRQRTDKIDISIYESDLQSIWNDATDNEIRFAVECKRIADLSDVNGYISDIEKFCQRFYPYGRLPFEGQIAFIENSTIRHLTLSEKINIALKSHDSIITCRLLEPVVLSDSFDASYLSIHQRNADKKRLSIYHLMLNYSTIVEE